MRVANGTTSRISKWVIFQYGVQGILRTVCAFIRPDYDTTEMSLLLGLPYLNSVNVVLNIRANTIIIGDKSDGKKGHYSGPKVRTTDERDSRPSIRSASLDLFPVRFETLLLVHPCT
jgi:hypothetical protein